jgi:hypothetical protein
VKPKEQMSFKKMERLSKISRPPKVLTDFNTVGNDRLLIEAIVPIGYVIFNGHNDYLVENTLQQYYLATS